LEIGTRIGSYEIVSAIGAGGMGEVYLATDAHLKRQVAIKVLPDAVASDPERMARFQREAEVLAAINHPNIAQIYGFEKSSGTLALVMELVEGPTLADLIAGSGKLPFADALQIARQIAQALDFAHERGIVHRDLKPANIKVRDDGTVKVLDFGLAKLSDPNPAANPSLTMSPTLSVHATMAGVILGTAAYMSPEQARGKAVDKRTDIWAFGCVLFEMLTGERLFRGEDLTETLASIVKDQPDFSKAPPQVQRLLRKCLEKDPRKRLRDLGDIEELIDEAHVATAAAVTARGSWLPWAVTGVLALALAGVSFAYLSEAPTAARRMHLFVSLPDNAAPGFFAIAPDARSVVLSYQGKLAIRSLESGELRTLSGTDGARAPFWSADSRTIGFLSPNDRKLKIIPASGGVPQVLCDEVATAGSGSWHRDGTILVAARAALLRVSASGGGCTPIPNPDKVLARGFPVFLPGSDHFLFIQSSADEAATGLYVASLRDLAGKRLLADESSAVFAPDAAGSLRGRILFVRENTLMAQPFDAVALELSGDPSPVANNVRFTLNLPQIAASAADDGTLLYLANSRADRQLIWYDRTGAEVSRGAMTNANGITLSPDGKRVAFHRTDARGLSIWIEDFDRRQEMRLTEPTVYSGPAAWSPDSQSVAYLGVRGPADAAQIGFFVKGVNSANEQVIAGQLVSAAAQSQRYVSDWSRDGRWLIYSSGSAKTGSDIWLVPAAPSATAPAPVPLLRTDAMESQGQLSPDMRWLAYVSDEGGGGSRVFVRPFNGAAPLPDTKWQLSASSASAREPRWRADGKELFFLELPLNHHTRPRLMAVPMEAGPQSAGAPKPLFEFQTSLNVTRTNVFAYAPSLDGQRFVVDAFAANVQPTLEVILNWPGGR
jgi:hypothetical protein